MGPMSWTSTTSSTRLSGACLRVRGFGLSALGSPIGKIRITEPFDNHLLRFGRALDLADFYQTPRIRVFSFYIPPGEDPADHRDEVMRQDEGTGTPGRRAGA